MQMNPRWIALAKRWAASWWSMGFQLATLVFNATFLAFLLFHYDAFARGVVPHFPASLFGEDLFLVMPKDSAMTEWYLEVAYFGISLPILVFSIWYCWLFRRRLQNETTASVG